MITRALRAYFITDTTITNLLASTTDIRSGKEPTGTTSAFVTILTDFEEEDTVSRLNPGLTGLKEQDVEIICQAASVEEARTLVWAVRDSINTKGRGDLGSLVFVSSFSDFRITQRQERQLGGKDRAIPAFDLRATFVYTEL